MPLITSHPVQITPSILPRPHWAAFFLRYRLEEAGNPLRSSETEEALLPKKPVAPPSMVWIETKEANPYKYH